MSDTNLLTKPKGCRGFELQRRRRASNASLRLYCRLRTFRTAALRQTQSFAPPHLCAQGVFSEADDKTAQRVKAHPSVSPPPRSHLLCFLQRASLSVRQGLEDSASFTQYGPPGTRRAIRRLAFRPKCREPKDGQLGAPVMAGAPVFIDKVKKGVDPLSIIHGRLTLAQTDCRHHCPWLCPCWGNGRPRNPTPSNCSHRLVPPYRFRPNEPVDNRNKNGTRP